MEFYYQFDTVMGALFLQGDEKNLLRLSFSLEKEVEFTATALLLEAERQLLAYFSGELEEFSLPYDLNQLAKENPSRIVLQAIKNIPYGTIQTYGGLKLPPESAYPGRFVGQVCHFNPLPIIIPCHRVCGKDGSMKGYAGGLARKKFLLDMENPFHGYTAN